jgi:hypothetical protein
VRWGEPGRVLEWVEVLQSRRFREFYAAVTVKGCSGVRGWQVCRKSRVGSFQVAVRLVCMRDEHSGVAVSVPEFRNFQTALRSSSRGVENTDADSGRQ